ncbi:unnamed protein product [Ostreobium quekettii]|uniref:DNA (cytosine-5-)-methyltransferase n=1 Tax=Ostreobium quekettii TaxID=121088 RepID=A0A8S1ISC4_9CHLO|nr:unnamed protein product [Ostreobium quekettii]|eukprot:evm.model.scf_295.5 EVM.evm.TU.scf_295.5   scf_295:40938-55017(-)
MSEYSWSSSQGETPSWGSRWKGAPIGEGPDGKVLYSCVEMEPMNDAEEPFEVCIGDSVEIFADADEASKLPKLPDGSDRVYVLKVTKLWEGPWQGAKDAKCFEGEWFYTLWDTVILTEVKGRARLPTVGKGFEPLDLRQVFKADPNEDLWEQTCEVAVIKRVVRVLHVTPGNPAPDIGSCDYWWALTHSRRFHTFQDHDHRPTMAQENRALNSVEIYSGCGGFSFVAQRSELGSVEVRHAVDIFEDALSTFKVNHPSTHVHLMHVDEFLFVCQKLRQLRRKHLERPNCDPNGGNRQEHETQYQGCITSVKVGHPPTKEWVPGEGGNTLDQLPEDLTEENSWLMFEYSSWPGSSEQGRCWLKESTVPLRALVAFLKGVVKHGTFPSPRELANSPGDVDLICGGPPCQGISCQNYVAKTEDILEDERNKQIIVFLKAVMVFKPSFVLLENVLATFEKHREDGLYMKFAIATLLSMGYQTRLGVVSSDDQGVPEARRRFFLWAAKSGAEALPPFPRPVFHSIRRWDVGPCRMDCAVYTEEDNRGGPKGIKLFPPLVVGDALSDLPPVTNYCFADAMDYKLPPQRPYQLWMRRKPPTWEPSLEERARAADWLMESGKDRALALLTGNVGLGERERLATLGDLVMGRTCQPEAFEGRQVQCANEEATPSAQRQFELWSRAFRRGQLYRLGKFVELELERDAHARESGRPCPLRDHLPIKLRSVEYDRVMAVPKSSEGVDGPDFRSMRGVVMHRNGNW